MPLDRVAPNLGASHVPVRDGVAAKLRLLILEGDIAVGTHLVEDGIAQRFGVSRNTVRDAIQILTSEGFIESVPRKGAFVSRHSPEEASDIFELRLALEPLGARLAARHSNPETLAVLQEVVDRAERASSARALDTLADLNTEFHTRIVELGGNEYLSRAAAPMIKRSQWLVRATVDTRALHSWVEHRQLLAAIGSHDENVSEATARKHIMASRRYLNSHPHDTLPDLTAAVHDARFR